MNSIDNIAKMLEPDNEIKRVRITLRLNELATELQLYHIEHPDTTLSQERILRRIKRKIVVQVVRNYMFGALSYCLPRLIHHKRN